MSSQSGLNTEESSRIVKRRVFALGSMRFQVQHRRVVDACLDGLNWALEGFVYLVGPLLILFALGIAYILTYTFFTILFPMLQLKYAELPFKNLYLGLHCTWVVFLLVNVLFNYFFCVITRNSGSNYDKVVRELAEAANFPYPETPAQVASYRRDYEDRMVLRMRRRQARAAEAATAQESHNGVTHRKSSNTPTTNNATKEAIPQIVASKPLRTWMVMGPFEWGYCANSDQPKPPRSHFDHVSKKLVLNLDHFCPWMANAIGYFNYRYFVNFLIYIFLAMLYGCLLTWEPFMLIQSPEYRKQWKAERAAGHRLPRELPMLPYRDEKMLVTLGFMMSVAVGFAIVILGGFHIYLTLTAQTTIEFHANWANKRKAARLGKKYKNPYDQGYLKNWQSVYGTQYWLWSLLPSWREPEFLPVPIPGQDVRREVKGLEKESAEEVNGEEVV